MSEVGQYVMDVASARKLTEEIKAACRDLSRASLGQPSQSRPNCADDLYFIRAGEDGPIKIGRSMSPRLRLAQLQTASPYQLHLIGVLRGAGVQERKWHARYASFRMGGEWHEPIPELIDHIAFALKDQELS